jgi:hypothetical protein
VTVAAAIKTTLAITCSGFEMHLTKEMTECFDHWHTKTSCTTILTNCGWWLESEQLVPSSCLGTWNGTVPTAEIQALYKALNSFTCFACVPDADSQSNSFVQYCV